MFAEFVLAVQNQDKRNVFKPFHGDVSSIPIEFLEFYKANNPVDVEIRLDDLSQIRFYSIDRLPAIKKEYSLLESAFCFATSNGDPVYYLDGKVYTEAHGGNPKPELLAKSFVDYIQFIREHLSPANQ